ncbi:MAG: phosphoglucosamine mutase [Chthoniobacterales bacterium]|nr:phosphoglucosamine mutase [Chthoniobacterales bacterium]
MSRKFFGTDGIRGRAGEHPITTEFAEQLGRALVRVLRKGEPVVAIGRDTRASGPALEEALARGISGAGGRVRLLGVLPTPGVAAYAREHDLAAGAVISASHNPADDNGIKFFWGDGFKLPDEAEEAIEAEIGESGDANARAGTITEATDALDFYIDHALRSLPDTFSLRGLSIAVDCANGAAFRATPRALERLGADTHVFHAGPDGNNINLGCGSTIPGEIGRLVRESGAQVGLAHDGDADRLLLCDETGDPLDGDELLLMAGLDLLGRGELAGNTIVATVMSNLGLDEAMENAGGKVVRAAVGDRYVLEAMRGGGYVLGGEQSGHMIFLRHGTTGDGLVAALQILRLMVESGKTLGELRKVLKKYPQAQRAVAVKSKPPLESLPGVAKAMAEAGRAVEPRGRVLVRYSGTEPKLRILLEGRDPDALEKHADAVAEAVREAIGS